MSSCDRVADLEDRVRAGVPEAELGSPDPLVQRTMSRARIVATSGAVVLLRGKNGTGKGVLARALHA
jgi:NtrC-family two-component system response regulator AlgB